jgi:aspartate-semialdehyde dehydrogenase
MRIAVVGATGLVGTVMLQVLEERNFPIDELLLVASERSVGKTLPFKGEKLTVIGLEAAVNKRPDIALFSAGGGISIEWAPKFASA